MTTIQNRYSLVISPPNEIISLVKSMKEKLAEEIGWYHSKNSLAHITINEFMATDNEIENIKKQLINICDGIKPIDVHLDHFNTYPNGAFFIAPDDFSIIELKQIMTQIHQLFRTKTLLKSNEPHLSIGRQLKPDYIATAYRLFPFINLNFRCDSVTLRRFNPIIKQFEIIDRFSFNDNPKPVYKQGTLF
ncbi:2'-5' RNA ligase family protein [Flavobacterium ovatum]|uniref:2'-5' RNA ligase family protein n=1 Tax=Flavobacterium ovatum TaxID=1928857 RepID=UPI00344C276E